MPEGKRIKILIIEDDVDIVRFVKLELEHEGYRVFTALDGREGLKISLEQDADVILLDIMLPKLSGIEVLRRLRRSKQTPVIMLTARDAVTDKVLGLDAGANDYITKPFHMEEVLARIRSVTRAQGDSRDEMLNAGSLSMNTLQHTAFLDGAQIDLTKTEYDLLEYLMRNKNVALTREQIISAVWGYHYTGDSNVVDVYIRYLRIKTKVKNGTAKHFIETIRGLGYVLREKT
jgi:DNA-binding response OmpR family regulator